MGWQPQRRDPTPLRRHFGPGLPRPPRLSGEDRAELRGALSESGCDYLDICGEPEFMERMEAAENGSLVVSACGRVEAYLSLESDRRIGVNYATYESAVLGVANADKLAELRRSGPRQLRPKIPRSAPRKRSVIEQQKELGLWALRLPSADSSVVRRTQAAFTKNPQGLAGMKESIEHAKSSERASEAESREMASAQVPVLVQPWTVQEEGAFRRGSGERYLQDSRMNTNDRRLGKLRPPQRPDPEPPYGLPDRGGADWDKQHRRYTQPTYRRPQHHQPDRYPPPPPYQPDRRRPYHLHQTRYPLPEHYQPFDYGEVITHTHSPTRDGDGELCDSEDSILDAELCDSENSILEAVAKKLMDHGLPSENWGSRKVEMADSKTNKLLGLQRSVESGHMTSGNEGDGAGDWVFDDPNDAAPVLPDDRDNLPKGGVCVRPD
ncbi:hypothetical protein SASPL_139819 [Salvia splendens]|uniref:Uncharacterized protein n=1 Tax=Salvia splendens TaxID=180675 RepID=A0A8X8WP92_SALSN|nr:hypothetical protein SASPL_139819 [Salvia splendens]